MPLTTAKQLAYKAKHADTSNDERIQHLTEAVYALVQVVEAHEQTIRSSSPLTAKKLIA
jgi:hypothetical protein